MKRTIWLLTCALAGLLIPEHWVCGALSGDKPPQGYYRFPSVYGDSIVFTAEGDLWRVGLKGGVAQRLTSHPGEESRAAFSPDGKTLAFSAQYEGPLEIYTMPAEGGLPTRRTFEGGRALVAGWTAEGKVLYATHRFSTLPDWQLAVVDLKSGRTEALALSQASDGVLDSGGNTLYFTRQQFQGSSTKRYQGGTAQQLWKFTFDTPEAVALTADFAGTSKSPMLWKERIYFLTDRDGTMNICHKFSTMGMNIIGVPKTIDNDLEATDMTFGYDSALAVATEAIDRRPGPEPRQGLERIHDFSSISLSSLRASAISCCDALPPARACRTGPT